MRATAVWSGSIEPAPPTCTSVAPDPATHSASTLEAAGRPTRTITSGRSVAAVGSWRSRASKATMEPSSTRTRDVGSASTGHPVAETNAAVGPGGTPPPASTTPRRDPSSSTRSSGTSGSPAATAGGAGRRGGSLPGSPTSGSRNGRFRWTGPSRTASTSRRPSDRHVDAAASSAIPGSWYQRTARPNRLVWSIVCGAPTSRSSAGRSAVSTSIGTPDSPASTTAGCRLAAAVPLVHSTIAGVPARPSPRATKPAARSSCTTCSVSSDRAARASSIGVLREPGATTAWRTPLAISSSARVAQNVAWAWLTAVTIRLVG